MAGPGLITTRDYIHTIEKQAAWDTAIDSTSTGLPIETMEIKQPPGNMTVPHSSGTRSLSEISTYNDISGVISTATMSVMPVTPELMTLIMPGILQHNGATGSGGWVASPANVFTMFPNEVAALPLMRDSDEGSFYTLVRTHPTNSTTSDRIINALPTSMKLAIHPTDDNGVLVFKPIEWIGQGYTNSVNPGATVTQAPLSVLYKWSTIFAFSVDGNAMTNDFFSMEIDLSYGAKYQFDTINGDAVFPEFTCGGTFVVAKNANTEALKDACHTDVVSNAIAILLQWGDGTVSASGELNLTLYAYLRDYDITYEDGEQITFTFEGCLASAGEYPFSSKHFDD